MPITHADLTRRSRRAGSKLALLLLVLSILCGLSSFVLCLATEGSRSEATWFVRSSPDDGEVSECVYGSSGRTPLGCAVAAFLLLAVAMFTEHAFMLVSVSSPRSPTLESWMGHADPSSVSPSYRALTWQACLLFLTTCMISQLGYRICFVIAEVLLMIGISVESGHLSRWKSFRSRCTVVRPGLFAAAGVLGLTTVFFGVGLYLTALKMQRLQLEEQEGVRPGTPRLHWVTPSVPREPPPTRGPVSLEGVKH